MTRPHWPDDATARREIVAAATRLFRQRSYPTVGMRDVAAALDIGVATLYAHVRTKEELLGWCHVDGNRVVYERLVELTREATTFRELFVGWASAFYPHYALTGMHLSLVLLRPDGREVLGEQVARDLVEEGTAMLDLASTTVRRLIAEHGGDTGKATVIVELAWATMQGLADHYSGERHLLLRHSWRELAETFADVCAGFVGLRTDGSLTDGASSPVATTVDD